MQTQKKKRTPPHLSFGTTATLMGLSLAIAIGMIPYAGSNGSLAKRSPLEVRVRGIENEDTRNKTVSKKVTPMGLASAISPKDAYHDALERMLTNVSYDEWQTYIETHPFIREVIQVSDVTDSLLNYAYASTRGTQPSKEMLDSFGLPIGSRWHT